MIKSQDITQLSECGNVTTTSGFVFTLSLNVLPQFLTHFFTHFFLT